MASIGTVWDRAVDFVRDHLGAAMPVLLATQFAAPAINGSLAGLRAGGGGATTFALGLVSLVATLISLWGALYLVAFAAQPSGRETRQEAARLARSRFLPLIGVSLILIVGLGVLALPGVLLAVSSGFDFTAVMNGVQVQPEAFASLGPAVLYFVIVGLVMLWLSARLLPINAVIAMERRGIGAIGRAFALTRGMTFKLIGVLVLYGIVAVVAISAVQFVVGAVFAIFSGDATGITVAGVAGAVAVAAVSAALALYQTAFIGKLYRAIVGEQDDAAVFA